MDAIKYNQCILNGKCPYCQLRLGNFTRQESPKSEFKNCGRCGRKWEIIGSMPNGYPCELHEDKK